MAVTVEIHRVAAKAARHELPVAHGSGVRTARRQRIDALRAGQQQETLQLLAEIVRAPGVVEGQGGQGFQHPVFTHVAAVLGFDADDGHHIFRRHAVDLFGARQRRRVGPPERRAALDALGVEKNGAVAVPGLGFGRSGHGGDDAGLGVSAVESRLQPPRIETVLGRHLADERPHVGAAAQRLAGNRARRIRRRIRRRCGGWRGIRERARRGVRRALGRHGLRASAQQQQQSKQ